VSAAKKGKHAAELPAEPAYPAEVTDHAGQVWYRGRHRDAGWRTKGGAMRFSWSWERLCEYLPRDYRRTA
jgi:hypothetical protein